jgi:hypothetical protein
MWAHHTPRGRVASLAKRRTLASASRTHGCSNATACGTSAVIASRTAIHAISRTPKCASAANGRTARSRSGSDIDAVTAACNHSAAHWRTTSLGCVASCVASWSRRGCWSSTAYNQSEIARWRCIGFSAASCASSGAAPVASASIAKSRRTAASNRAGRTAKNSVRLTVAKLPASSAASTAGGTSATRGAPLREVDGNAQSPITRSGTASGQTGANNAFRSAVNGSRPAP